MEEDGLTTKAESGCIQVVCMLVGVSQEYILSQVDRPHVYLPGGNNRVSKKHKGHDHSYIYVHNKFNVRNLAN